MGLARNRIAVRFLLGVAFFGVNSGLFAQGAVRPMPSDPSAAASQAEIPDAPTPRIEFALAEAPLSGQAQSAQQPAAGSSSAGTSDAEKNNASQSSSSQQNAAQPDARQSQHQKAEEEVKEQEHQRVAGIVPSFNVTYRSDAVSLSPAEKFRLQFRAATDPYTFTIAMIVAGLGEARDDDTGFGWGPGGYGKRAAAAYGDNVIGNTLGNAVLPVILHQDPRYFRLGHGSISRRFLYSFATSFVCKHDNTGRWEPNYSNVLGNMIAGEISNLYTPNNGNSNFGQTISTGITVTFEGAFGSELQEFWPDISRKFFHKDPTHGLDAQARAADAAARQKKQQEKAADHQP